MAKNAPFLLGCLLGSEEGAKVLAPHAAAMGLWNLCLDENSRNVIEEEGEVLPAVIDIVQKGVSEALTPCIGCLDALSRSSVEDVKQAIHKCTNTLVQRFEAHARDHSHAETVAIYGVLGNLSIDRPSRAVPIADRMLKPENMRALRNWVDKDLQTAATGFMEGISTCPELHARAMLHLDVGLAVEMINQKANKRAAHSALGYLGNLASKGDAHRDEVYRRLTTDGLKGLVHLTKAGTESMRCQVAAIMQPMVKQPGTVRMFRDTVPNLVPLLRSDNDGIIQTVTGTLWFMTYDDAVCMAIGAAGGIPLLVKQVTSKNHKIRLHTTGVLRNMAQHEALLAEIGQAKCPAHLLNVWKPISCPPVTLPTGPSPSTFPSVPLYML